MLKKLMVLMSALMLLSVNTLAADIMKISMDGEVKPAKEIGTGKGIAFTLPELEDDEYYINSIELAVFEKQYGDNEWKVFYYDNEDVTKKCSS